MKSIQIKRLDHPIKTSVSNIASDKSISHRCAMFALLSDKPSVIENFLQGEDTLDSLKIAQKLGAQVIKDGSKITLVPRHNITEPDDVLDCGNAGTGMRLYCGLLCALEGSFVLTGDKYLRKRPMSRVTKPLRDIGAKIDGADNANLAPIHIRGSKIKAFCYHSPIDSAQVKSALILAALKADGKCYYKENSLSRDHTERMLQGMGAKITHNETIENNGTTSDKWIGIEPLNKPLEPLHITVPADPSSAFFFAVAAAIVPQSCITLKNLTLNPTRIEAFKILEKMGADITYSLTQDYYEPIGDITIKHKYLHGVTVENNIAWLIDELPALSIAFACAKGLSVVKNAKELRVKESDRISTVVQNLQNCGIECKEYEDGYEVHGGILQSAVVNSYGDHRIAMSFAIAGLLCDITIKDTQCIDTSFPNFMEILYSL